MYFKINPSGCQEHKGLCEVRYDLFLSRTDEGNEEHYVTVPIFPEEGYTGEKGEMGMPTDKEAYDAWVASLPTETWNNPFCCHFYQFEPNVTDEEILAKGEEVLSMAFKNWATRELHKNKNDYRPLLSRAVYDQAKPIAEATVAVAKGEMKKGELTEMRKQGDPVGVEEMEPHIEEAITKIVDSKARMEAFHTTDFVALAEPMEAITKLRA
jgi:hypothetical protein